MKGGFKSGLILNVRKNKRARRDANSKVNKMVLALLAKNADVNIKDNMGTTSFSYGIDINEKY